MKLFVNGCSFSAGHDDVHTESGKLAPPSDYVWANTIKNNFDDVTNLSVAGSSNDRIVRTTLDYFEHNSSQDIIAVIQWTSPFRFEQYVPTFKNWIQFCNITDPQGCSIHCDDGKVLEKILKSKWSGYFQSIVKDQIEITRSVNDYVIKYIKNILVLECFLNLKGIPYVFTSMSSNTHVPLMSESTDFEQNLMSQTDFSKWTSKPLSSYAGKNVISATDTHPNQQGHADIGKMLLNKIQEISK